MKHKKGSSIRVVENDGKGHERAKKARELFSVKVLFEGSKENYPMVEEAIIQIMDKKDICVEREENRYINSKTNHYITMMERRNHKAILDKTKQEICSVLGGWKKRLKRSMPYLNMVEITVDYNRKEILLNLR